MRISICTLGVAYVVVMESHVPLANAQRVAKKQGERVLTVASVFEVFSYLLIKTPEPKPTSTPPKVAPFVPLAKDVSSCQGGTLRRRFKHHLKESRKCKELSSNNQMKKKKTKTKQKRKQKHKRKRKHKTKSPTVQLVSNPGPSTTVLTMLPTPGPTLTLPTRAPSATNAPTHVAGVPTIAIVTAPPTSAPSATSTVGGVPTSTPSFSMIPSTATAPSTRLPSMGTVVPTTAAPSTRVLVSSAPSTTRPSMAMVPMAMAPMSVAPMSVAPTMVPMALAPTNNVVVSATRFNVDYQLKGSNGAVTDTQFATVQNVTLQYLKDYLVKQFGFSIGTTLLDVVGTTVGHDNNKPQAIYDVKLVFSHDSISIPMQASVDVLVLSALNQPFVKDLIALLDALPSDNPFSTTSAVTYTPV